MSPYDLTNRERNLFHHLKKSLEEKYPELSFCEDADDAIYLLKSLDKRVWIRIFYEPLEESSASEFKAELKKLELLMPADAEIYVLSPSIHLNNNERFGSTSNPVYFFEFQAIPDPKTGSQISIRRWEGRRAQAIQPEVGHKKSSQFSLGAASKLSRGEIEDLANLGVELRRFVGED